MTQAPHALPATAIDLPTGTHDGHGSCVGTSRPRRFRKRGPHRFDQAGANWSHCGRGAWRKCWSYQQNYRGRSRARTKVRRFSQCEEALFRPIEDLVIQRVSVRSAQRGSPTDESRALSCPAWPAPPVDDTPPLPAPAVIAPPLVGAPEVPVPAPAPGAPPALLVGAEGGSELHPTSKISQLTAPKTRGTAENALIPRDGCASIRLLSQRFALTTQSSSLTTLAPSLPASHPPTTSCNGW